MNLAIYFVLILCFCAAYVQAQRRLCMAQPAVQECNSPRNVGRGGRGCTTTTMWYYRNGQCLSMQYLGCDGNANRYCTKAHCEQRCRGPG